MPIRTIPTISSLPELQQWRRALKGTIKKVAAPGIPRNFSVVSKQGGNYLTWAVTSGADGYEVDISTTGDFSTGITTVSLNSPDQVAYFDSVPTSGGAAPALRYYRVRATSGTITEPHSVKGGNSGVLSSTAIAPNDTTTTSTTGTDQYTSDEANAGSGRGKYYTF